MERVLAKLYLVVILLYLSQGLFYESGSFLSRLFILIWLFVDLIYAVRVFTTIKTNAIDKLIGIFVLMHSIYWCFSEKIVFGDYGATATFQILKNTLTVLLSYFPFRFFSYRKYIQKTDIMVFTIILMIIYIPQFFRHQAELMLLNDADDVTNNDAYNFVTLMPLFSLFLYRKKLLYPLIIISVIFILQGVKRGAILCLICLFLIILYYIIKSAKLHPKSGYVMFFFFVALVGYVTYRVYIGHEYLQFRILETEEGNSSGRGLIYSGLYNYCISRTNFIQMLFGSGYMATYGVVGVAAHQDWLELWTNNGLMGVIIYFCLFVSLYIYYIRNKKYMSDENKIMFLGAISVWVLKSMFSMGYYDQCVFVLMAAIAYVQAEVRERKMSLAS